jgi:S2P endopeptidase
LLICSVVHEMGHAITSVAEDVTVVGSGVFVFLFLPAAYVDISTIELVRTNKSNHESC